MLYNLVIHKITIYHLPYWLRLSFTFIMIALAGRN